MIRAISTTVALALVTWLIVMMSRGWAQATPGQFAEPAPRGQLVIDVDHGHVAVVAHDGELSEREVQALRTRLQARVTRSPLRERGRLHVTLQGQPLTELTARLQEVDLDDTRALDAVVDRFVEMRVAPNQERPLTEPIELVIGRQFAFGPSNMPGSIIAIGANGRIDGAVADVIAIGSRLQLGPEAQITQRLIGVGSDVERLEGANVAGQEVNVSLPAFEGWSRDFVTWRDAQKEPGVWSRLSWSLFGALLSFGLGMLLLRVSPVCSGRSLERMQRAPFSTFGIGVVHYFAIVPAAALLVLSIVGILLLPVYFVALGFVFWAAYVAGAAYLGTLLARTWQAWQQLLLGLALLAGVSFIPVLGGLTAFCFLTCGLGAVMLTLYQSVRNRPKRPAAPAAPAASSGSIEPAGATSAQHV